jgi:hypothetical protein
MDRVTGHGWLFTTFLFLRGSRSSYFHFRGPLLNYLSEIEDIVLVDTSLVVAIWQVVEQVADKAVAQMTVRSLISVTYLSVNTILLKPTGWDIPV